MNSESTSVLIVGGGQSPGRARLQTIAKGYDRIIAADGGLNTLLQADLMSAAVTGDFDSVSDESLQWVPAGRRHHNPDQRTTDLEKAMLLALATGADRLGLACATGGRIDHTINAISMMKRYKPRADIVLYDAHGEARLASPPEVELEGQVGDFVSLVPAPIARRLWSEGLRYPLEGLDLELGGRDGISNELTRTRARIRFESGSLLVYRRLA